MSDPSLKSSEWATNTSTPLLGGAVANDEPASLRFQLVFLHVVDHEDFYWCLLSNLFLDRFKN